MRLYSIKKDHNIFSENESILSESMNATNDKNMRTAKKKRSRSEVNE